MAVLLFLLLAATSQFLYSANAAPADGTAMDFKEMMKECNESFPINIDYLKALNETGSFPEEMDKTPKCYVRCMLMKAGVMDEAGTFDVPKLKQSYMDAKYPDSDSLVDMCIEQDTETKCMCNKAYLFAKCLMTQGKPTFPESPTVHDLSYDLKMIRLCNMTSPISLASMNTVLINRRLEGVNNAEGFKCFLHCLYTKYNWMDENGEFNLGNMKESLEAIKFDELVIDWLLFKCSTIGTSDRCERAFKFTECFWSETKSFGDEDYSSSYRID